MEIRTLTTDEEVAILQRFKGGDITSLSGLEAWIGWLHRRLENGTFSPEFKAALERNLALSTLALERIKDATPNEPDCDTRS
jgi:hypothetical protein